MNDDLHRKAWMLCNELASMTRNVEDLTYELAPRYRESYRRDVDSARRVMAEYLTMDKRS